MKNEHVISQFQAWFEKKLTGNQRQNLESHLNSCIQCREYFQKMSSVFEDKPIFILPYLKPDPFLITRIRAMTSEKNKVSIGDRIFGRFRWVIIGLLSSFAIWLGIILGTGLSSTSAAYSDKEIVTEYYQALSQSGIADRWENFLETNEEDEQ